MLVPFYDNLEATSPDDGTDLIEVERIENEESPPFL
jgi:hypothetical protein